MSNDDTYNTLDAAECGPFMRLSLLLLLSFWGNLILSTVGVVPMLVWLTDPLVVSYTSLGHC